MTSAPTPGARPRRRWIWVIVAVLTTLVIGLPAGLRVWLKADMQHGTDPFVVFRRPISTLQVDAPADDISVRSGRPGQVTVAGTLTWVFSRPVVAEVWHGKTLDVSVHCQRPDLFEDCAASLTLTVPPGVGVHADVGSGSITAAGLNGPLHLSATTGSITLDQVSGPVSVRASAGSISGQLTSLRLDATIGSGAVALTFDTAPTLLSLSVGSGAAQATVPAGSVYRVVRPAGPGALNVAPGLSDPNAVRTIKLRVGSGSLSVGYPGT